MNLMFF